MMLRTAPNMIRTMSHLKVQMLMREGGQQRGSCDRVQTGQRKMARNPVSSSWLSQPGTKPGHQIEGKDTTVLYTRVNGLAALRTLRVSKHMTVAPPLGLSLLVTIS